MRKYKYKRKKVYLDIAEIMLQRGGGNSMGHHTFPIYKIVNKLSEKYERPIIKRCLETLIKKEDLILWPKEAIKLDDSYDISINLEHYHTIKSYLVKRPDLLERFIDLGKEIGIEK